MPKFWQMAGQLAAGLAQAPEAVSPLFNNPIIPQAPGRMPSNSLNPSIPGPQVAQPLSTSNPSFQEQALKQFGPNDPILSQWGFYENDDPFGFKKQFPLSPASWGGTSTSNRPESDLISPVSIPG